MFLAIVSGIYRHEVLGIFSTMEKAKDAANAFFLLEKDHYHEVEIMPLELDKAHELKVYGKGGWPSVLEPEIILLEPST